MKKTILILLIFMLILFYSSIAQKQAYNWFFGNSASLSFNPDGNNPIFRLNSQLISPEGCASISDSTGNLLFYSDGNRVWDRNHNLLPNGTGLNGSPDATQSCIFIPKPDDKNIYYLFTLSSGAPSNLYYTTIDKRLNNGFGDVTQKNTFVAGNLSQKMTAGYSIDGSSIWLVLHGYQLNYFYSYKITKTGVNTTPVSSIDDFSISDLAGSKGCMKLSPDSKILALSMGSPPVTFPTFYVKKFSEGIVSSTPIDGTKWVLGSVYGVEFSPDSKCLYITSNNQIIQITFRENQLVEKDVTYINAANAWGLQLGPDGRIYVAQNNSNSLGRINSPNLTGSSCDYQPNQVSLGTALSQKGLPSFIQNYFIRIVMKSIVEVCEGESFVLNSELTGNAPNAIFQWYGPGGFSSTEQNPTISSANYSGYYRVSVSIGNLFLTDSTFVRLIPKVNFKLQAEKKYFCENDSVKLYPNIKITDELLLWSTGETADTIKVNTAGKYYLTIEKNGCKSIDSVEVFTSPSFNAEIKYSGIGVLCDDDTLSLFAFPTGSGYTYNWSTGQTTNKIVINKGGNYSVTIDHLGCSKTVSVYIRRLNKPEGKINSQSSLVFCTGDSVVLAVSPFIAENTYLWSTGESDSTITVKKSGIYWLEIFGKNGCTSIDTVSVTAEANLGIKILSIPETPLCDIDSAILFVYPPDAKFKFKWSTGEITDSIIVKKSGKYMVEVLNSSGCIGYDTINLIFSDKSKLILNKSLPINLCDLEPIEFSILNFTDFTNIKWSDGSSGSGMSISLPGSYFVVGINESGCKDSIGFDVNNYSKPKIKLDKSKAGIVCKGDSVQIFNIYQSKDCSYLWSTSETTDTITVHKSGTYFLSLSNGNCTVTDSIIVLFNPQPELHIISDKGFSICKGDSALLSTDAEYYKYIWSTGETTRSIIVTKEDDYSVLVSDVYGCTSTEKVHVKVAKLDLSFPGEITFGRTYLKSASTIEFKISNSSSDSVNLNQIYISNSKSSFNLDSISSKIINGSGGFITLKVSFNPLETGLIADTLILEVLTPCHQFVRIIFNGIGIGNSLVSIPDTSGLIGQKNFRIPLKAKHNLSKSQLLTLTYSGEIRILKDVFLPELLTNGVIKRDYISGLERILEISDTNVIIGSEQSVITELVGTILLGEHKKTPITLSNFKWSNQYIEVDTLHGSLLAIGACYQDISVISLYQNSIVNLTQSDDNSELIIDSKYPLERITIFNTLGSNLTYCCTANWSNNGKTCNMNINNLPQGLYFIRVGTLAIKFFKI